MTLPSSFTRNIRTCHSCAFRTQQCQGACPCRIDGRHIIDHAREHDCPLERFASRGLGDTIAWVIKRAGLEPWIARLGRKRPKADKSAGENATAGHPPCGCAKRRQALNAMVTYRRI